MGQIARDSLQAKLHQAFSYIANNPDGARQIAQQCMEAGIFYGDYDVQITSGRVIGQVFINQGRLEEADSVLSRVILLGERTGAHLSAAHAKINYGNLQLKTGSYAKALDAYSKARSTFESYEDTSGIIKAVTNTGICHMFFANYEAASLEFHYALDLAQKHRYSRFEGLIKNNLGRLQIKVKNYDRALDYLRQSIDILKKDENLVSVARGQALLAKVLNLQKVHGKALAAALDAESLSSTLKDHQGIVDARIVIGEIYQELQNEEQALRYYHQAQEYARKYNLNEQLNQTQIEMSKLYRSQKKYDSAYSMINEAVQLAARLRNDENYYNASKEKEAFFVATGQLDSAIVVLREMEQYVRNLEGNYDRIKLLESENDLSNIRAQLTEMEVAELRLSQAIAWLVTLVVFVLLIAMTAFVVYRSRQRSKLLQYEKNEEVLRSKNLEIKKNKEIESIKAEIKGQELERRRLAQELHDGLGGTLSSIKLNLTVMEKEKRVKHDLKSIIQKIDNACNEVRTISHHLMPPAFSNHRFSEAVEFLLDDLKQTKKLDITYEIFPKDEIESIDPKLQNDLYRIIQEIVSNTLKHAEAISIDLQLVLHEEGISLIVEDDGKGFDVEASSSGIGLKNIRSRLELYQGVLRIDSMQNRGTVTDIYIPIRDEEDKGNGR